jgi:4'-phosphopantetheinyl transferase
MRCRFWLRALLSRRLGVTPSSIKFSTGPHGKPFLRTATQPVSFNASHSGGWFAVAVTEESEIGLDIEGARPGFPALDVARQFFTPAEEIALARLGGVERERLFFRLWTAKEALMKATGLGVKLAPNSIAVEITSETAAGYASHPQFSLTQIEWRPGLWAALASPSTEISVEWRLFGKTGQRPGRVQPQIAPELPAHGIDQLFEAGKVPHDGENRRA